MSDRLPPEIAALLTDGEQLVVGDLVLADVRRLLASAASKLSAQRGEIIRLVRDLVVAKAEASRLRESWIAARHVVFAARAVVAAFDDPLGHTGSYSRRSLVLANLRDVTSAYDQRNHEGIAASSDNAVPPAEGAVVEGPQG